jgi:FkbM family methyltransferase
MFMDLEQTNSIAVSRRRTLPQTNNFTIGELHALPDFYGYVRCLDGPLSFNMFLGGSDDGVALRFFWNGQFEKTALNIWTKLARNSSLIVDVGAHTGTFTLAASSANPSAKVISFEPYFLNWARLNLNLRTNSIETSNAFMLAAADRNCVLPFSVNTNPGYLSTGGRIGHGGALELQVQAVALDAFFPRDIHGKLDLFKIDTEGTEAQALKGMESILTHANPTIFLNVFDSGAAQAVADILLSRGYRFFLVNDLTGDIEEVETLVPIFDDRGKPRLDVINRIATKKLSKPDLLALR